MDMLFVAGIVMNVGQVVVFYPEVYRDDAMILKPQFSSDIELNEECAHANSIK